MTQVTPLRLRIAISRSALFDLSAADQVFREEGLAAYGNYQRAREKETLTPGPAFPLARKLLSLGDLEDISVEVVLLSRNSADTGLRVFNSIQAHELPIIRAAFTGGGAPYRYMQPFQCQLFLSTNPIDVTDALDHGVAAATCSSAESLRTRMGRLNLHSMVMRYSFPMKLNRFIRERA